MNHKRHLREQAETCRRNRSKKHHHRRRPEPTAGAPRLRTPSETDAGTLVTTFRIKLPSYSITGGFVPGSYRILEGAPSLAAIRGIEETVAKMNEQAQEAGPP